MNDGTEAGVVADFVAWLEAQGWTVTTEVDWADVVAERGVERLIGEAKGVTSEIGLDVDTMYGQLLRRMTLSEEGTTYALIVPERALPKALRVPAAIREALKIAVYVVTLAGEVTCH